MLFLWILRIAVSFFVIGGIITYLAIRRKRSTRPTPAHPAPHAPATPAAPAQAHGGHGGHGPATPTAPWFKFKPSLFWAGFVVALIFAGLFYSGNLPGYATASEVQAVAPSFPFWALVAVLAIIVWLQFWLLFAIISWILRISWIFLLVLIAIICLWFWWSQPAEPIWVEVYEFSNGVRNKTPSVKKLVPFTYDLQRTVEFEVIGGKAIFDFPHYGETTFSPGEKCNLPKGGVYKGKTHVRRARWWD